MTEREQKIYDFLTNADYLISFSNKVPQYYNTKQINLFSDLEVRESELKSMKNKGFLNCIKSKSHGNCYIVR